MRPTRKHIKQKPRVNKARTIEQEPPMTPVAIKRLIEEVKGDNPLPQGGYNRTYHRHNR